MLHRSLLRLALTVSHAAISQSAHPLHETPSPTPSRVSEISKSLGD